MACEASSRATSNTSCRTSLLLDAEEKAAVGAARIPPAAFPAGPTTVALMILCITVGVLRARAVFVSTALTVDTGAVTTHLAPTGVAVARSFAVAHRQIRAATVPTFAESLWAAGL
jgi:hypothetical protein